MAERDRELAYMAGKVRNRLLASARYGRGGPRQDIVDKLASFLLDTGREPGCRELSTAVRTLSYDEAEELGFLVDSVTVLDLAYDLLCHAIMPTSDLDLIRRLTETLEQEEHNGSQDSLGR